MSRTPQQLAGSRAYREGWRAVNLLIRSGGSWSGRERDVCYRNEGGGRFSDQSFLTGLDSAGDGRAFVTLDLDGDGALDLALGSRTAPRVSLLRNQPPPGPVLLLELAGAREPDAIGARAELRTDRRALTRWVEANSGYLSQSSRRLHFALEPGEIARELVITWPEGERQTVSTVPTRGLYRLRQGERTPAQLAFAPAPVRRTLSAPAAVPPAPGLLEPVPAPPLDGLPAARRTLVSFWASWCPPCQQEIREWSAGAARLTASGLRVVLVPVDSTGPRPAVPFAFARPTETQLAAWNVFHQNLFDHRAELALPTSFLLDERQRVVKVYHGMTSVSQLLADARAAALPGLPFPGRWFGPTPRRNFGELAAALAEHGLAAESLPYFALADPVPEVLNNHAAALLETGSLDQAASLLERLVATGTPPADAWVNLGLVRLRQHRAPAAQEAFARALALAPDDAAALDGAGSARFAQQDPVGALDHFRQAVRLAPENASFRYNLASVLAAQGQYAEALAEFERVRSAQPESVPLANNLGILYVETGAPQRGEAEFRRAMTLAPRDPGAWLNLATLLARTGRLPEARETLERFLVLAPGDAAARQMLDALR